MCLTWVPASLAGAQTVPSSAQTSSPAPRPARDKGIEIAISAVWMGSVSFGSADANIQTNSGTPLTLFQTSSRESAGTGVEANVGFRITRRLAAEVGGSWVTSEIRTSLSGDFEGADPITATVGVTHFTVEGSALWTLIDRRRTKVFVRGGVGWMRDLDESSILLVDGTVATIGGGMKYWWRDQPRGAFRKLGLRVEARAAIRSAGIALDDRSRRVSPVVAGGLIIGF